MYTLARWSCIQAMNVPERFGWLCRTHHPCRQYRSLSAREGLRTRIRPRLVRVRAQPTLHYVIPAMTRVRCMWPPRTRGGYYACHVQTAYMLNKYFDQGLLPFPIRPYIIEGSDVLCPSPRRTQYDAIATSYSTWRERARRHEKRGYSTTTL